MLNCNIELLPDTVSDSIIDRMLYMSEPELGRNRSIYFNGYNGAWCHRFGDWLPMHAGLWICVEFTRRHHPDHWRERSGSCRIYLRRGGKVLNVTSDENLIDTLGKIQPFRYRGYVYDVETELYYVPAYCVSQRPGLRSKTAGLRSKRPHDIFTIL